MFSQYFGFERKDTFLVINNATASNDTLSMAWSGGLSYIQISGLEINSDTDEDLFVFDRAGNKFVFFENLGIPNLPKYKLNLDHYGAIPTFTDWGLLLDYNNDGKKDLFHYYLGGVSVYKNTSVGSSLSFELVKRALRSLYGATNIILYVSSADIPAITDVDDDGDIDILTFGFSSGCMEFHQNQSMEIYGVPDSLEFIRVTDNFGLFAEGASLYDITLNDSCDTARHAGSSSIYYDVNNDGKKDLVLGDASGNNLALLMNAGTNANAIINFVDPQFPQNTSSTIPVNLPVFNAAYFLDVNNNGIKDIIVSNNSTNSSKSNQSIWRYNNINTNTDWKLVYQEDNFLQNEMIEVGEGAFPTLTDLNRDGLMDIVIGNSQYFSGFGQLCALLNTGSLGNPKFEIINYNFANVSSFSKLAITPTFGDIDGDGDNDMIIGDLTGYIHLYTNTAPVTAGSMANYVLTSTNYFNIKETNFSAPFLIDLNQDGKLDIVCGNRKGFLNYYENIGTTTVPNFSATPTIDTLGDVSTINPLFGSNGHSIPYFKTIDGKLELFLGSLSGYVFHYTDIYAGTSIADNFSLQESQLANFKDGSRSAVCIEDWNADGFMDMIYGNWSGGVDLLLGKISTFSIEEELSQTNYRIYPNPSNDIIHINSDINYSNIDYYMYSIYGQLLEVKRNFSLNQPIDISSYHDGVYIISIYRNNRLVSNIKWIKN